MFARGLSQLIALLAVAACGDDNGRSIGEVFVFERTMNGMELTIVTAGFESRTVLSIRDEGPCHIESQLDGTFESAGTLTITGTSGTATLAPDARTAYGASSSGLRYSANEALTISASGATAPAFSGALVFPAVLTLSSALPSAVSKSGLSIAWPPALGDVSIAINQAPEVLIRCKYAGADGAATITASTLADLAVGDNAFVMISSETTTRLTAGDYDVSLYGLFQPFAQSLPVQP